MATTNWLKQQSRPQKIALFVAAATQTEFSDFSLCHEEDDDATAVVVGDLGEQWTFEVLNRAFRLLMQQPQPTLIALGMTRYWQASDGLRLDVAPFIAALQCASGVEALVLGKPALPFYQAAIDILATDAKHIVMLGDDIKGDVAGAQQAGMQGVLVKTGKFRAADLQQNIEPDAVLDSIKDFPDWWQQHYR